MQKVNYFITRECLLPKSEPGTYRSIMINNLPLRLLDKMVYSKVSHIELINADSIHGFTTGISTRTS